jgi:MFS family permease
LAVRSRLPAIQKQFGNSLSEIQWVSLMGVVTISSLSFCFGRSGGIFGQRLVYKIGVALYASGAGVGAIATSFAALLIARAVMAIGLAMALPMSTAILASSFEARRRGQVLGWFASAIAVGRMTGPAVGGFLLQFGDWTWIFWMNFVIGFVVTAAVARIFRGPGSRRQEAFDIWGTLFLLIGYPALLIALTFGAILGWTAERVLGLFLVAAVALAAFVWIELHTTKPLVDVGIFKHKTLAGAMLATVLSHGSIIPSAAPLYRKRAYLLPQDSACRPAVVHGVGLAASGRMADRRCRHGRQFTWR